MKKEWEVEGITNLKADKAIRKYLSSYVIRAQTFLAKNSKSNTLYKSKLALNLTLFFFRFLTSFWEIFITPPL